MPVPPPTSSKHAGVVERVARGEYGCHVASPAGQGQSQVPGRGAALHRRLDPFTEDERGSLAGGVGPRGPVGPEPLDQLDDARALGRKPDISPDVESSPRFQMLSRKRRELEPSVAVRRQQPHRPQCRDEDDRGPLGQCQLRAERSGVIGLAARRPNTLKWATAAVNSSVAMFPR